MNKPFVDYLNQAFSSSSYSSLKELHRRGGLSFSYEYLRQIFLGLRVPNSEKLVELARALRVKQSELLQQAAEAKFEKVVAAHYLPNGATPRLRLAEKKKQYSTNHALDQKILRIVERLDVPQKEQLLEYLKFLKQQWRKTRSKNEKK